MTRSTFEWTADRIQDARRLRDLGLSGRDIAERFGISRSAVLGMFKREADKAALAAGETPPK